MTIKEIKQHSDYLAEKFLDKGRGGDYICPVCGHGTGRGYTKDGLKRVISRDGYPAWYCHACQEKPFDIVDLFMATYYCDIKTAIKRLTELAGGSSIEPVKRIEKLEPAEPVIDYSTYYREAIQHLPDSPGYFYCRKRGWSDETIRRSLIGYDPAWVSPAARRSGKHPKAEPAIILPCSRNHYMARKISGGLLPKMHETGNGKMSLYRSSDLYDPAVVWVTECMTDAISLLEAGAKSVVSLHSAQSHKPLIDAIKAKKPHGTLILALDQDNMQGHNSGAGERGTKTLAAKLKELGVKYQVAWSDVYQGCNDINDSLVYDPNGLKEVVDDYERTLRWLDMMDSREY